jgi:hypothetical protein
VRKRGGDDRAQPHELKRLLRDASEDRWDNQPFTRVDLDDGVFHPANLILRKLSLPLCEAAFPSLHQPLVSKAMAR